MDLAELLARQFESLGEGRPRHPRVSEDSGSLRFTFVWPLQSWEAVMVGTGYEGRLQAFRLEFLRAVAPSLAEVVEVERGRAAEPASFGIEAGGRQATVELVLGAATEDLAESWEAIRNWGSQVRRNARRQRAEHRRAAAAVTRTARAAAETRRRVRNPGR